MTYSHCVKVEIEGQIDGERCRVNACMRGLKKLQMLKRMMDEKKVFIFALSTVVFHGKEIEIVKCNNVQ